MYKSVLEKTALLGLLRGDLSTDLDDGLEGYAVSAVTIGDLYGDLIHDHEVDPDVVEAILDQAYTVIPCTQAMAEMAAKLRPLTAHHGLSMADRCCLSTAKILRTSVTTGNLAWRKLQIAEVNIEVLR